VKINATFVTSAPDAADIPDEGLPEIGLVGRSNVGKSSLINALLHLRLARTSAAPGKTRLLNVYRVARGHARPFFLVDLPGYGYARGGQEAARVFERLTERYFVRPEPGTAGRTGPDTGRHGTKAGRRLPASPSALLLVDSRHPGLASDLAAWEWLQDAVECCGLVATKIDKLARGERVRAMREIESVFAGPVLPVSAATGEGLDKLWTLIDKLASSRNPPPRPEAPRPAAPPPSPEK
jgi:GTP-binding protein